MYKIEKLVSSSHVGPDGKLTLTAAVDFMQDCSFFQINSVPGLMQEFSARNMAMFIVSRQVDIIDMPCFGDLLTVETSVWELNRIFGSRNTVIYDEEGRQRLISYATGAFVSLANGRPAQISEEIVKEVPLEEKIEMEYQSRKIRIPLTDPVFPDRIRVLKSHLDHYNHVNNSRYIMMAFEYLPDQFGVKRLRVEYKIPAKYGEEVSPVIYTDDNRKVICLADSNGSSYAVVEFSS